MAGSVESNIRKELAMGDRIARQAARIKKQSLQPRPPNSPGSNSPSSGKSLASLISKAIDRPGVTSSARPTTADGTSTSHFSVTTITKGSIATVMMTGAARPGAGVAHQKYVEREGAAENIVSEFVQESMTIGSEQQQYLEREGAVEQGRSLASFGNIANSYEERLAFWKAVEDHEYSPKTHLLKLAPELDPDFWKAVDTISLEAPEILVNCDRSKRSEIRIKDADAVEIIKFAKAHVKKFNDKTSALTIDAGPGGRIQTRLIAELPHELDAEKRIEIARRFCEDRIANIDPDYEDGKRTLRYWAVIHAPDNHNDKRNNHLHVVFYERPTDRKIDKKDGKEKWDFTITEQYVNYRKTRTKNLEKERCRIINNRNWVTESRAYFATLVNEALKDAGVSRRVDLRSYDAIGIDATPIPRIGPKAYQKEKRGIPTPAGDKTIAAQWDRDRARLAALYDRVAFDKEIAERFTKRIATMRKLVDPRVHEATTAFENWKDAFFKKRDMLAERAAVLHNYQKVRSHMTPPLDPRPVGVIAETKALIDDMQKETLAPYNKGYRAALVDERKALDALKELETNRRTKIDPTPIVFPVLPPAAKVAIKNVPPKIPEAPALHAKPAAVKPIITPIVAQATPAASVKQPAPAIRQTQPTAAFRQSDHVKKGPTLAPPPLGPRPAFAQPNIGIKITEPPKAPPQPNVQQAPKKEIPAQSEWKKKIIQGLNATIQMFSVPGSLEAYMATMDQPFAPLVMNTKLIEDLDKKIAEEKAAIETMLRNGLRIKDTTGFKKEGLDFINERLKVIEAEKAAEAVEVAPNKQPSPQPSPQPIKFSEAVEATRAAVQAQRKLEIAAKAAEDSARDTVRVAPSIKSVNIVESALVATPAPQQASPARVNAVSQPSSEVIPRRKFKRRPLTEQEKHDIAFPDPDKLDPLKLADMAKAALAPKSAASAVTAPRAPLNPQRAVSTDEKTEARIPAFEANTAEPKAARSDKAPVPNTAEVSGNIPSRLPAAGLAPIDKSHASKDPRNDKVGSQRSPPIFPAANTPNSAAAPEVATNRESVVRQPMVDTAVSMPDAKPTVAMTKPPIAETAQTANRPVEGQVIVIADDGKKKRRKRQKEISPEERRRILIAQQKARSGPGL